jgi:Flp pilus assembly protein protease CpaA
LFAGLAIGAAVLDIRARRVPNALTLGGTALALLTQWGLGRHVLLDGLLGMGVALAIGFLLYAVRGWGAGDGKLLMMTGAFLGFHDLPGALLAIALIGGIMAAIQAARRGVLVPVLLNLRGILTGFGGGHREPRIRIEEGLDLPYGVAVSAGALLWWFAGGFWP